MFTHVCVFVYLLPLAGSYSASLVSVHACRRRNCGVSPPQSAATFQTHTDTTASTIQLKYSKHPQIPRPHTPHGHEYLRFYSASPKRIAFTFQPKATVSTADVVSEMGSLITHRMKKVFHVSYCDLTSESLALYCTTTPTPLSATKITEQRESEKGQ